VSVKSKILIGFFALLGMGILDVYGQNEIVSDNLETDFDLSKILTDDVMNYATLGMVLILILTVIIILKKQPQLGPRKFRV
jgi:hypothetical protein